MKDFPEIVDIERRCFKDNLSYSKRQLHYLVTKAHSMVLIYTDKNHIIGFIIVLYRRGSQVAGIETIDVDPVYQHQGIGSRLLQAAFKEMKGQGIQRVRLEVASTNHDAIQVYKKAGFSTVTVLKDYYQYTHKGTRDALRMIKQLL